MERLNVFNYSLVKAEDKGPKDPFRVSNPTKNNKEEAHVTVSID
jgi:hypothetical protein